MRRRLPLFALPLLLLAACGEDHHDDGSVGPDTGAVCPDGGTTLTYENFGQAFMEDYCLRCHSSALSGDARGGAPADHNFDTHLEIAAFADHIDQKAGSGPDSTNTSMPADDGAAPSLAERQQLSEWLACGAPPPL